jgi:ADP-heptose:LPS heptosyltransferase
MKVLIIRFSSIGDIVLTTPVLRCFKQQYPNGTLHYLTKATFHDVLRHNPHIDKLHLMVDNDLDCLLPELQAERYDHIIDLHNNLRTLRVKKALKGVPATAYKKLNVQKWLLTNLKWNMMPDESIVDRYLAAAAPIKVKNDGAGLDYYTHATEAIEANDIPMSHWNGYVACVIGGSYATKKFPVAQWQAFCSQVPYPVMLLGGPEDAQDGAAIAAQDTIKIYNSCGKFSLNESAGLLRFARVVVTNDTGLMHIAAAYKKPIVSLWGNTSPEMGMFPYYGFNNLHARQAQQSILHENKQLGCHPCSKIGYDKCPRGHFKCMQGLDTVQIVADVTRLWQQQTAK